MGDRPDTDTVLNRDLLGDMQRDRNPGSLGAGVASQIGGGCRRLDRRSRCWPWVVWLVIGECHGGVLWMSSRCERWRRATAGPGFSANRSVVVYYGRGWGRSW